HVRRHAHLLWGQKNGASERRHQRSQVEGPVRFVTARRSAPRADPAAGLPGDWRVRLRTAPASCPEGSLPLGRQDCDLDLGLDVVAEVQLDGKTAHLLDRRIEYHHFSIDGITPAPERLGNL